MAEFVGLEDGTGHLLLETSGGLLTDQSSPQERSASFAATSLVRASPAPPTHLAGNWRAGTITVPGGTGNVSVTGLGGIPSAVFFYGTNWDTEDTPITSSGSGMFRGMAGPLYSSPSTIVQATACSLPPGAAGGYAPGFCMNMLDPPGGLAFQYAAQFVSFDADGFTVNFSILSGAGAGQKVVYLALMDANDIGGFSGTNNNNVSLGFKAGSSMVMGSIGTSGGIADLGQSHEFYASGAYPSTSSLNWMGAGLSAYTFPASASAQYNIGIFNLPPDSAIAQAGAFIGPFLSPQNVQAYPNGVGMFNMVATSFNQGSFIAWDDEESATGRLTPATNAGDSVVVSGLPFAPGLVIGYSVSDEPNGLGTGGRGAIGFSAVTSDGFQWAAIADGVSSRGAFQSYQLGFADCVNGTDVHAGTMFLTNNGFVMTTTIDDATPQTWVWHAFGHAGQRKTWLPHIYRRLV